MQIKSDEWKSRDVLRQALIGRFAIRSEITSIHLFGREAIGEHDVYSDIDMIVCSADLAATQRHYLTTFSAISPIRGTLLLESSADNLSQMVMLQDYSPYQKVDFSIVNNIAYRVERGFGPFLCVYEASDSPQPSPTQLTIVHENPVVNQLQDFLFAVPHFTKCLFRQDLDLYRRWKGISNMVLVLLHEKYTGWQLTTTLKALPSREANRLYKQIEADEQAALTAIFPANAEVNLARSYQQCIELLTRLCCEKALYFDVEVDKAFIDFMQDFLVAETWRFLS